jgi:hypothetical protein
MFEGGGKTGPRSGQFSKAAGNRNIEQKSKKKIKAIFLGFSGEGRGMCVQAAMAPRYH